MRWLVYSVYSSLSEIVVKGQLYIAKCASLPLLFLLTAHIAVIDIIITTAAAAATTTKSWTHSAKSRNLKPDR